MRRKTLLKKIIVIMIIINILLLDFPIFCLSSYAVDDGETIEDTVGPVIESIELSSEEVSPGDILKVKVIATDESNISEVRIDYTKGYNGGGLGKWLLAEKQEDGSFVGNIEITETFFSDYYRISTDAMDEYGNNASISRDAIFKVVGGIDDITGPEVIISTDKQEVNYGETVTVTACVTDESKINNVSAGYYLLKPNTYYYEVINIELTKKDDNTYIGTIDILEDFKNGKYLVSGYAEDIYGNTASKETDAVFYVGHNWDENYTIDKEATCTEKGQQSIHCSVCNAIKENSAVEIDFKEHNWDDGIITTEPTITEAGEKVYTCIDCERTKTETVIYTPNVGDIITIDDLKYEIQNYNKVVVSARDINISEKISIPEKIVCCGEEYEVYAIDLKGFYACTLITEVVIPDTVTYILNSAFENCNLLESINLPNSITSIGDDAFSNCTSLKEIIIPDSVTSLGTSAFYNCYSLEKVKLSNNINKIKYWTFANCESLKEIVIPDSVTNLQIKSFCGCENLTNISLSNNLTVIESDVFSGCTSLQSIEIPNSVTEIGGTAFFGCVSLVTINIPQNITKISSGLFQDCISLKEIIIPDSVTEIGDQAFLGCTSLVSITIPSRVTVINGYCFYRCSSLENIDLPNNLIKIGDGAFRECYAIENLIIPSTVKSISTKKAFYGCNQITTYCNAEYVLNYARENDIAINIIHIDGELECKLKTNVKGTITSFLNEEDITISLIKDGSTEISYEKVIKGNTVDYLIEDVLVGSYNLVVKKANHVTREYKITVDGLYTIKDINICLVGDMNADGKTNNKDWDKLYRHINGTSELQEYQLLCADVNEDGKVNNKDWNRLYNHIIEVNPLW